MAKRIRGIYVESKQKEVELLCGDCEEAQPVTDDYLSVKDKRPLMARCPHKKYMVLLSHKACTEHFKKKED